MCVQRGPNSGHLGAMRALWGQSPHEVPPAPPPQDCTCPLKISKRLKTSLQVPSKGNVLLGGGVTCEPHRDIDCWPVPPQSFHRVGSEQPGGNPAQLRHHQGHTWRLSSDDFLLWGFLGGILNFHDARQNFSGITKTLA